MENTFSRKKYPFIILFLLVLFYALNNYIWLNLNEFPPFAGEAYHLLRSLDYFNILTFPSRHMFSALIEVDYDRPPLFPISMAISNIIFDNSRMVSTMTNIFFICLLFFSTYYIGKKIQDNKTGLLAAFILAMYPFVFGLSRIARSNVASMALVCLSLYCVLYTDRFRRTLPSVFSGLFIGLGILTGRGFVFFVVGPVISMLVIGLKDKDSVPIRKKIILNFSLASIIAIILGGIWYFPKFPFLLKNYVDITYFREYPSVRFPKLFSLQSFIFYLRGLINGQISPFLAIFFFLGLIAIIKRRKVNPLLFSWIIVSFIILTLIKYKEFRETSEYLPAFALITASGILKLKKQLLRRCLVYAIIVGGLAQYFIISYTNPSSTGIKLSFFNGKLAEGINVSSYLYPINEVFFHYPRRGDWKINKIISTIEKESFGAKNDITIGVTDAYIDVKTDWFDPFRLDTWHENFVATSIDAITYFLRTNGLYYNVVSLCYLQGDWRRRPLLDFIVSVKKIEELASSIPSSYKLILQTEAPDRSPIYVYKKEHL